MKRISAEPSIGEALKGSELGEFWSYRIGDWRLICEVQDKQFLIIGLTLGNLRDVYRGCNFLARETHRFGFCALVGSVGTK